ncbi:phosphatase [Mycobacterium phage Leopard]|uniref:Phosphatase n=1 Tax=Mycobacterium phage Onyinye TaxID=2686235 RepID=A0A6B9LI28_9CAUD|nr:polynucleotide kinase [Mycobacterium phage Onyinye]QHB37484.1 phosphatase [Mycobacterium phage Onyinye]UOW92956.1 phosphatase [Mycobacterium phage Leopard]WKW85242.1 phosphatase [Mycobacterium phage Aikoy]
MNLEKPVVAIDIDGTLGDYHGHFLHFAEAWYGRPMPAADDINPGLPLHKFMRTSKATYRQCKLAYRQGGLERSMPVYPGAAELTRCLRKAGAEVWLCTTRPYLKLDTQSPNTQHWLRRNKIQFDHLLSGPHKYRDLVKQVGAQRVIGVLDDLPEMYEQAESLGLEPILRDQPYNRHVVFNRVKDLDIALIALRGRVFRWKEKNHV